MDASTVGRVLVACTAIILVLVFVIPSAYPFGTFTGLDGSAGILDHGGMWASKDPVSAAIYGIGDLMCHQEESRSFIVNGSQIAFCKRDTAILAGLVLGSILSDRKLRLLDMSDRRIPYAGIVLIAISVVEWCVEKSMSADVPALRIVAGVASGVGLALIICYFAHSQYEKAMEKE